MIEQRSREESLRQSHVRCFSGFLLEFLRQMAAHQQAKESRDAGTQTSPGTRTSPGKDSLGNCRLLSLSRPPVSPSEGSGLPCRVMSLAGKGARSGGRAAGFPRCPRWRGQDVPSSAAPPSVSARAALPRTRGDA